MTSSLSALDRARSPRELIAHLTRVLARGDGPPIDPTGDAPTSDDPEPDVPYAVGILPPEPRTLSLAVQPLVTGDPVEQLLGFVAPADWLAFGVHVAGRWFALDSSEARYHQRVPRGPRGQVRIVHLVDREGRAYLAVVRPGHAPHYDELEPGPLWLGRVDDAVRRTLALPTTAPERDVHELWAVVWLDVIAERALLGERLRWADVAAAHPAVAQPDAQPPDGVWSLSAFLHRCHDFAEQRTWRQVRLACGSGALALASVTPDVAEWMDDGIFSRWVLGTYPEAGELAHDLLPVLDADAAAPVRRALREWGLLS